MKTLVYWDQFGEMAAIEFSGGYTPQEPPSNPINHILEIMYDMNREGENRNFYMYECWNNDTLKGMLFAEAMEVEEPEMFALFQRTIDNAKAANVTGRFETKVFNA